MNELCVLKGNYDEVYEQIKTEYFNESVELCSWFASCSCPDLSIEEVVKLYAALRREIDGDIVVRYVTEDEIELLDTGKYISKSELIIE